MEQRGIELVPASERYGRPRDLLFLWAGTTTTVFTVVYGTIVVAMGLSFWQAVAAIVIGNLLAFPLVGFSSIQGMQHGTSTMAISRAAYGNKGARVLGFFGWLNMVGFEAGGMVMITLAGLTLLKQAGVEGEGLGLKVAIVLIAAVIQLILPLIGHAAVMKAQKYLTWVFVAMFVVMAILVAPKANLTAGGSADFSTFTLAVMLVMSGGGLSWAPLGGDYSRYLPVDSSRKAVFGYAFLGGFVPYLLLMILGAAVATVVTNASDPISGLPGALPSWFVVPYLLLTVVTLFAANTTDLYSSGLNLQAAGIRIKRWAAVVLDLIFCVIITFVAITSDSFNTMLNAFLGLVVVWLAPLGGHLRHRLAAPQGRLRRRLAVRRERAWPDPLGGPDRPGGRHARRGALAQLQRLRRLAVQRHRRLGLQHLRRLRRRRCRLRRPGPPRGPRQGARPCMTCSMWPTAAGPPTRSSRTG
ncbi:purine-cytosine permease family protein [Nonomuraea dietziae]|uniref:purine-cytosine permease family protein n=1 Tax=Nonomuraea dietziae TaxID=65515 RepID=UPI0031DE2D83